MAAKKRITKKNKTSKAKHTGSKLANPEFGEDADLSPAQRRELDKRIDDLNDRTRYLLASTLGPNFVLYYNLSEDTYGWNDPSHATLFKRRKAAQAIQQLLGDKDSIVECAVDKKGKLDKKSVGKPGRSSKPSSRKKSAKKKP
jgi:hypothetical protein